MREKNIFSYNIIYQTFKIFRWTKKNLNKKNKKKKPDGWMKKILFQTKKILPLIFDREREKKIVYFILALFTDCAQFSFFISLFNLKDGIKFFIII